MSQPTPRTKRERKPSLTRSQLMEMYVVAERKEPRTLEFIAWLTGIRAQAPQEQQIEGGA